LKLNGLIRHGAQMAMTPEEDHTTRLGAVLQLMAGEFLDGKEDDPRLGQWFLDYAGQRVALQEEADAAKGTQLKQALMQWQQQIQAELQRRAQMPPQPQSMGGMAS